MKELLKKKTTKIGIAVIILAIAIGIISINARSAQRQREYDGHVEDAEKYLTELDYEQAIAEYTLALEIEPNAEEVLNALEQTYLAYAQSLADAGDYEKAVSVLEEGYAQTGRECLQTKVEELLNNLEFLTAYGGVGSYRVLIQLAFNAKFLEGEKQYISDAQIKELCSPAINYLEQYSTFYELDIWRRHELCDFYYWIGEFEKCKEMYKQEEWIDEEEKWYSEYFYNEYGRPVSFKFVGEDGESEDVYEYGEDGKIVKKTIYGRSDVDESIYETVYEYDTEGRILKTREVVYYAIDDIEQIHVYTYVYNETGFTKHYSYEDSHGYICGWAKDYEIINEYGEAVELGETYDIY